MEASNDYRPSQTQRVLPYPPDAVYAAFADPARLAKWWGPKDFTNTFESFEFTIGGDWTYTMHGPDGRDYANKSVFRDLVAGSRVVIEHVSLPRYTLTVSLRPVDGGTEILWVQGFEDPKVGKAIRRIVEPANEENLDRLHMNLRGEL